MEESIAFQRSTLFASNLPWAGLGRSFVFQTRRYFIAAEEGPAP